MTLLLRTMFALSSPPSRSRSGRRGQQKGLAMTSARPQSRWAWRRCRSSRPSQRSPRELSSETKRTGLGFAHIAHAHHLHSPATHTLDFCTDPETGAASRRRSTADVQQPMMTMTCGASGSIVERTALSAAALSSSSSDLRSTIGMGNWGEMGEWAMGHAWNMGWGGSVSRCEWPDHR